MLIFVVFLTAFGTLLVLDRVGFRPTALRSWQAKTAVALALMFLFAATGRLANIEGLVQKLPASLPLRREAVYLSGVVEVLGAVGLLLPRLRRLAGLGIILFLLVVFPANVNVAVHNLQIPGFPSAPIVQWIRLPLQFVLIGLTWWATQPAGVLKSRPFQRVPAPSRELASTGR